MTALGLLAGDLDHVFPFHIAVDRELRVIQVGRSLAKVLPELVVGSLLEDQCAMVRPHAALSYEVLRERGLKVCVLSARNRELVLKGQIIAREDSDALLFLGSPRLTTAAELSNLGITIDDFAVHDAIVDFLFLLHAQQTSLAEANAMTDRFAAQRSEVREANHRITTLYMASQILADSPNLEVALSALRPALAKALGCETVSEWRLQDGQPVCGVIFPDGASTRTPRLAGTDGLVAEIFSTGEPTWVGAGERHNHRSHRLLTGASGADEIDPPTLRYNRDKPASPVAVCGFPVIDDGRVIAVVVIEVPTIVHRSDDLLYLLGEIAIRLVQFTAHHRAAFETAAARDAALASVRAKTEFLANVSHEIRTPLSAVLGMTSALRGMRLPAPADGMIDDIQSAGHTLLRLVDDLLDESRIEAGKLSIELAPFDLSALVRGVAAPFQASAASRGLPVIVEMSSELRGELIGDRVRIGQVLANLIGNAVKFTEAGRVHVDVRSVDAEPDHATLTIAIADTGIGISADQLERVFEPFTQADGSTTRKFGGAGLGLSISRRLLALMGGTIGVTSAPGAGSTFTMVLRLARASANAIAVTRTRTPLRGPGMTATRRRVLVVEDNPLGQRATRLMLEQLGHEVDVVGDGAAAIDAVTRTGYDLVLMDCHLPVLDGFEATRRIRALPGPIGRVPIVACTASVMIDERRRCFEVGMDAVVIKPLSPDELRRVVDGTPPAADPVERASGTPDVLDRERIALLRGLAVGSGRGALGHMIELYRAHAPIHLTSLEAAAAACDTGALRRAAHALHGMSLNIGAAAVARACASVERAAAAGTVATLDEIRLTYQDTLVALAELPP